MEKMEGGTEAYSHGIPEEKDCGAERTIPESKNVGNEEFKGYPLSQEL